MLSHDREPIRFDNFDTAVKEKKPRTVGLLDRIIFRYRIGHRVRQIQQTMRETRNTFWEYLVNLDDADLVVRVVCLGRQRFDVPLKRFRVMASSNNDRNFSRLQQLASDTEGVRSPADSKMGRFAATLQVTFNCKP